MSKDRLLSDEDYEEMASTPIGELSEYEIKLFLQERPSYEQPL